MKNRPLAQNNITRIRESLPITKNFDNEIYIYEKFQREGFNSLTSIQKKSIPIIARKINTLIVAPTGSGNGSRSDPYTFLVEQRMPLSS